MLLNGLSLFGYPTRAMGPSFNYRNQREQLPGVSGYRIYRMGGGARVWTIRGRLTTATLAQLTSLILTGQGYNNGKLYTFEDNGGTKFTNCLLTDYRMAGQIEACTLASGQGGFTVEITATVEQIST